MDEVRPNLCATFHNCQYFSLIKIHSTTLEARKKLYVLAIVRSGNDVPVEATDVLRVWPDGGCHKEEDRIVNENDAFSGAFSFR